MKPTPQQSSQNELIIDLETPAEQCIWGELHAGLMKVKFVLKGQWLDEFVLAKPQFKIEIADICWLLRMFLVPVGHALWPKCLQNDFCKFAINWYSSFEHIKKSWPTLSGNVDKSPTSTMFKRVSQEHPNFGIRIHECSKRFGGSGIGVAKFWASCGNPLPLMEKCIDKTGFKAMAIGAALQHHL